MTTILLTERDKDLLRVLDRTPATLRQLLKASETFAEPHTNIAYLGRRLQKLAQSGWVRSWQYATTSRGALNYYRLTRDGFRQIHGPDAALPEKRFFGPVAVALQNHTHMLADVIVHVMAAAHRYGIRISDFRRENAVTLQVGEQRQQPDASIQLIAPSGAAFNFLFEIDAGTEPVNSVRERESIRQKIAFHERFQDQLLQLWRKDGKHGQPRRYRLVFFTKTIARAYHILSLAAELAANRDRRLCYGITIPEFLAEHDAIRTPCFLDHQGHWHPLVNTHPTTKYRRSPARLSPLAPAGVF